MFSARFKLAPSLPHRFDTGGKAGVPGSRPAGSGAEPSHSSPASGRIVDPDLRSRPRGRLNLLLSCATWRDDTWADRLPCLLEPMGVSAVRATTARHAERVIRTTPIHIAVVDLGLPLDESADSDDEAGTRVLDLLARLGEPVPTVVVQSPRSQRDGRRTMAAALNCGAFAVVDRSAADLEFMLGIMRRCLDRFYVGRWPTAGDVV